MRNYLLAGGLLGWCIFGITALKAQGAPIVIDHTAVAQVGSLPQSVIDRTASDLSFYFAHASVGVGMYQGLQVLHDENPARYPLDVVSVYGDAAPATVSSGIVYEDDRGNPGWKEKVDMFADQLANGWGAKSKVVMNKFCYIDMSAELDYYAIANANHTAMSELELLYPNTRFVYMTLPLTIADPEDEISLWFNRSRTEFNDQLRAWTRANNKTLFDVADIQAWSTTGIQTTFVMDGQTYQSLTPEYAGPDGQHPNDLGSRQLALGFYALGASLVPEPTFAMLVAAGAMPLLLVRPRSKTSNVSL